MLIPDAKSITSLTIYYYLFKMDFLKKREIEFLEFSANTNPVVYYLTNNMQKTIM